MSDEQKKPFGEQSFSDDNTNIDPNTAPSPYGTYEQTPPARSVSSSGAKSLKDSQGMVSLSTLLELQAAEEQELETQKLQQRVQYLTIGSVVLGILTAVLLIYTGLSAAGVFDEAEVATETPIADADGDGLPDEIDTCPFGGDVGLGVNEDGCPILVADSDGDGVVDAVDACPEVAGSLTNGCIPTPLPPTVAPPYDVYIFKAVENVYLGQIVPITLQTPNTNAGIVRIQLAGGTAELSLSPTMDSTATTFDVNLTGGEFTLYLRAIPPVSEVALQVYFPSTEGATDYTVQGSELRFPTRRDDVGVVLTLSEGGVTTLGQPTYVNLTVSSENSVDFREYDVSLRLFDEAEIIVPDIRLVDDSVQTLVTVSEPNEDGETEEITQTVYNDLPTSITLTPNEVVTVGVLLPNTWTQANVNFTLRANIQNLGTGLDPILASATLTVPVQISCVLTNNTESTIAVYSEPASTGTTTYNFEVGQSLTLNAQNGDGWFRVQGPVEGVADTVLELWVEQQPLAGFNLTPQSICQNLPVEGAQ